MELIYMSISVEMLIDQLEHEGKLRRFEPTSRQAPKRRVFLAKAAQADFDSHKSAVNIKCGQGHIRAALTRWVNEQRVYQGFLKPLKPPPRDIWEIRVTPPKNHVRLIGCFAVPNTLVLTKFYTRAHLGPYGSPAWKSAMGNCAHAWNSLFPSIAPFWAKTIAEYVTENCDDFEI
jgi:hypothetical protein